MTSVSRLSLVFSFLVVAAWVVPAAAADRAGWTVVQTPNPSPEGNYLSALAAVSPTDMWAVGAWYRPSSTPGTLTEHWNGSAWQVVPSPNETEGYNELYGVSAVSSKDVWAVGYHNISAYGSEKTMALHWNGSAWSIVTTPNMGSNANQLYDVAAVAANDAWAVGLGASTSNEVGRPLVMRWNGVRWSLVRTPNLGSGFGALIGVTAISPVDVWAVGVSNDHTLIEHWDGTSWSVVPSPNGSRPESELYAVAGTGSVDVWAVGESYGSSSGGTLIEHWDGARWRLVPGPNGSKPFTALADVAALGSGDVWAVGTTYDPILVNYKTFTDHWNGSSWTVVPSPNPARGVDDLEAVLGFAGGTTWAVGAAHINTLAMRTTGA